MRPKFTEIPHPHCGASCDSGLMISPNSSTASSTTSTVDGRKKSRINLRLLHDIRDLSSKGCKAKEIAEQLDMHISTVRKCLMKISEAEDEGVELSTLCKAPGRKPHDRTAEVKQALLQMVSEDSTLSQKGMQMKLSEKGINISQPLISKYLKDMQITRKRLKTRRSDNECTPAGIKQQKDYANSVINIPLEKLYFTGECGFSLFQSSYYGYSYKNSEAYRSNNDSTSRSLTVIFILSLEGIKCFKMVWKRTADQDDLIGLMEEWDHDSPGGMLVVDREKFGEIDMNRWKEVKKKHCPSITYLPDSNTSLNPAESLRNTMCKKLHQYRPIARTLNDLSRHVVNMIEDLDSYAPDTVRTLYYNMKDSLMKITS